MAGVVMAGKTRQGPPKPCLRCSCHFPRPGPSWGLVLPSGQIKVARLVTAETGQRAVLARSGDKRAKELPDNFHLKNLENGVRLTRPTQLPP